MSPPRNPVVHNPPTRAAIERYVLTVESESGRVLQVEQEDIETGVRRTVDVEFQAGLPRQEVVRLFRKTLFNILPSGVLRKPKRPGEGGGER